MKIGGGEFQLGVSMDVTQLYEQFPVKYSTDQGLIPEIHR